MIYVVFKNGKNTVEAKNFPLDIDFNTINDYISRHWKEKETWKIFVNGQRVSFKQLFHKGFELRRNQNES